MKKSIIFIIIVLFAFITTSIYLLNRKDKNNINCSTFRITTVSVHSPTKYFGCGIELRLTDGMTLKVANLNNYIFIFNKYLLINLVQIKNGSLQSKWYLAKVFNKDGGIALTIKQDREISSNVDDETTFLDINSFKKWLDKNKFKNKQVVAFLYQPGGLIKQYFVGLYVYVEDVKKD